MISVYPRVSRSAGGARCAKHISGSVGVGTQVCCLRCGCASSSRARPPLGCGRRAAHVLQSAARLLCGGGLSRWPRRVVSCAALARRRVAQVCFVAAASCLTCAGDLAFARRAARECCVGPAPMERGGPALDVSWSLGMAAACRVAAARRGLQARTGRRGCTSGSGGEAGLCDAL